MEDGVLEVEQRPEVHQGCCHSALHSIELADEGAKELERELVLLEQQCQVYLGAEIADLCAWDPELHANNIRM